jgi:N-acetylmuramoyl-L-alanine amidase
MLLKRGVRSRNVKELQELLGIVADGHFGSKTEEAVKIFQQKNNLTVDGVVGAKTWALLSRLYEGRVKPIYATNVESEDDSDPEEEMVLTAVNEDVPTSKKITELIYLIESYNLVRRVDTLVFHCTATPPNSTISSILNHWRTGLNWKNPGYHIIIKNDGSWTMLLDFNKVSNGVKGINHRSIHVSYIGGIENKRAKDTRTEAQKEVLTNIYESFNKKIPNLKFHGHNHFSNKACPCFDVYEFISSINTSRDLQEV